MFSAPMTDNAVGRPPGSGGWISTRKYPSLSKLKICQDVFHLPSCERSKSEQFLAMQTFNMQR